MKYLKPTYRFNYSTDLQLEDIKYKLYEVVEFDRRNPISNQAPNANYYGKKISDFEYEVFLANWISKLFFNLIPSGPVSTIYLENGKVKVSVLNYYMIFIALICAFFVAFIFILPWDLSTLSEIVLLLIFILIPVGLIIYARWIMKITVQRIKRVIEQKILNENRG